MGKAKKRSKYVSKGKIPSVNAAILKQTKAMRTPGEVMFNKVVPFLKGMGRPTSKRNKRHDPWITVPNSNKKQTNQRFVRIRMSEVLIRDFDDKKARS